MSSHPRRRYHGVAAAAIAAIALAAWPLRSTGGSAAPGSAAMASRLGKGDFLVAGRELADPNFAQTVVLLLEHGPEGTLGLIVNRPTTRKLAELLPDVEGLDEREDTVYLGGPVLPDAMLVLARSDCDPPGSKEVLEGVCYSGSRELLAELVGSGGSTFRVYAGHAGWAPGQLEWELRRRSWHVVPADGAAVFDEEPLELWDRMIRRGTTLLASVRVPSPKGGPGLLSEPDA